MCLALPPHVVIDMVCRGAGCTMGQYSAASREFEAGHATMAPVVGLMTGWVVVWAKERDVSIAAHRMVEAAQAEFASRQAASK